MFVIDYLNESTQMLLIKSRKKILHLDWIESRDEELQNIVYMRAPELQNTRSER